MSRSRFEHVLRVEETAIKLAQQFDADQEKASIAALLHDYAKEASHKRMRDVIIQENMDLEMLDYGGSIWHGPIGAVWAEREIGVTDTDILEAIAEHTVGAPEMNVISQIVFVADYIEPGRDHDAVHQARKKAKKSLKKAIQFILKETIIHLANHKKAIYPKTIQTYNAWCQK